MAKSFSNIHMQKVVNEIEPLIDKLNQFSYDKLQEAEEKYMEKQEQLTELDNQIQQESKLKRLDMEIALKKDKEQFMRNVATELKYVIISQEDHNRLRNEVTDIESRIEKEKEIK